MQNESQPKLSQFTKEEIASIQVEMDAVLEKHSATFVCHPIITNTGTIGAELQVFKIEKGVPSPYVGTDADTTKAA